MTLHEKIPCSLGKSESDDSQSKSLKQAIKEARIRLQKNKYTSPTFHVSNQLDVKEVRRRLQVAKYKSKGSELIS